jgi:opacity protein-like surface antigen
MLPRSGPLTASHPVLILGEAIMRPLWFVLLGLLAFGVLQGPEPVAAQMDIEITPFAGGTFFLNAPPNQFAIPRRNGTELLVTEGKFDDGPTLGFLLGLRLEERYAIEGMFSWVSTGLRGGGGLGGPIDAHSYMYSLNFVFHLPMDGRVQPFLGLGVGGETYDYKLSTLENHTEWMGNVAAGLTIPMTSLAALRLEVRDCLTRFESHVTNFGNVTQNDLMLSAGVTFDVTGNR